MTKFIATASLAMAIGFAGPLIAEPPQIQNSGPIIYLAENLDEKDRLGWCLDTLGRGLSEAVQTHSCKPNSGDSRNRDVLFSYDAETGRIEHAEYVGLCLTTNGIGARTAFGLFDCEEGAPSQTFQFDPDTAAIHPMDDASYCVTAGAESRQAGPYMSRSLELELCNAVDPSLRQWVIKAAE